MRLKVIAVCFLCSSAAAFAAEPAWELAPPDAKVLVGIDIRGLRNSSLNDSMTNTSSAQMRAQMQALTMFHVPGIELLDDIDSVFLASTGDLLQPSKTAAPGKKAGTPFLLAISGTFPDEHLRPLLKGPHPSYKGINVYRGTDANPASIAILDEHTVLIGDDKSIYRAIDRKSTGVQAQGPLFTRARELAAANEVWIVARDASGNLQKAAGPGAELASEIDGLDLGVAVRDGFNMEISLATKTEAEAQAISQLFLTQMQAAAATKLDAAKTAALWKNVKVGAEGNRMLVQVAMTKEELKENMRLMQEQRASQAASQLTSHANGTPDSPIASAQPPMNSPQPPTVSTQPAAPPKPRVVKIYGLDDQVREVPLDRRN